MAFGASGLVAQTIPAGVYDLPPFSVGSDESIGSNTTLNLYDGGVVGQSFSAGSFGQTSSQLEINLAGGSIDSFFSAYDGAVVEVTGGNIGGSATAYSGSQIHVSAGSIGSGLEILGGQVEVDGGTIVGRVEIWSGGELSVLSGDGGSVAYLSGSSTLNVAGGEVDTRNTMFGTINLSGGEITGRMVTGQGAELNISGGLLRDVIVYYQSHVNLSGGKITGFDIVNASSMEMTGGVIESYPTVYIGSNIPARLAGGVIADRIEKRAGSQRLVLAGTDFRLDGTPIEDADGEGVQLEFDLPAGAVLTGVYADGTPFAYSSLEGDDLPAGSLLLEQAPFVGTHPATVTLPTDAAPQGVHAGQTLNIEQGAEVASHLMAGWGSQVNVTGGTVGYDFEAAGATVNMTGGEVGNLFDLFHGTQLTLSGGMLGQAGKSHGASVHQTGGVIDREFVATGGSTVVLAGGAVGDAVELDQTSSLALQGGEFRLDGELIDGLMNVGDQVPLDLQAGQVLSGTLADGTPFAFAAGFALDEDTLPAGTLTLHRANLPAVGAATIDASVDPVPLGVRGGQTLQVPVAASVPNHFNAGRGSQIAITGGNIGDNFEATAATVVLESGSIGESFDAFDAAVVEMSGGTLGNQAQFVGGSQLLLSGGNAGNVDALGNSAIEVTGGTLASATLSEGSTLEISQGEIDAIYVNTATATIDGGTVGFFRADSGSDITLRGGRIRKNVETRPGSSVRLVGAEFFIDTTPVTELPAVGDQSALEVPEGSVLSGTLADGSVFVIPNLATLSGSVAAGTLTIERVDVPPSVPITYTVPADPAPVSLRGGQSVVVEAGGTLPEDFFASHASSVHLREGGTIAPGLRAVGAELTIEGGVVEQGLTLLAGSELTMSGGTLQGFSRSGATVAGGTFTLAGGVVEGAMLVTEGGTLNLEGYNFTLNGQPLEGLVAGQATTIAEREGQLLAGYLLDGTPFDFKLQTSTSRSFDIFSLDSTVTVTPLTPNILAGDYNDDGLVDLSDYNLWRDNLGGSADALANNLDGDTVDIAHFATWKNSLIASAGTAGPQLMLAVPEPSSCGLLLATVGFVVWCCRKRGCLA